MTQIPAFDRAMQRRILETLSRRYPDAAGPGDMAEISEATDLRRELHYLEAHGLVIFKNVEYSGGSQLRDMRITAKGIDFLADDGGLGAILGVVTVRLDVASLQALLVKEVEKSAETDTVKRKLVSQIKALPAEAVKALATEGVKGALRHAPNAMQWLQSVLSSLMQ